MLNVAIGHAGARVFYVAPTYKQAEMIAWKMLLEMVPPQAMRKKNEVKLEVQLANGSEISLKGADNEDSLRGTGLHFVVLDEFSMMKPNVWPEIIRPMLSDTQGRALFIGTPKGKNHFWDLFMKGERGEAGYSSHKYKTEDNPFIQRSEIEEARKQLSEIYFRQEYESSFEDFTGLVYPEFGSRHIQSFEKQDWWETICGIDPALSGTTACVFVGVDDQGKLWVFDEFYEQNKRVSDVAESIKTKAQAYVIDPASKIRNVQRQGSLYSLADEYADCGVYPEPGENDVDAGIARVAEYFKKDMIVIHPCCKNLIHELERYRWADERETSLGLAKAKPYKSHDHACDALRYVVMSRPANAVKKQAEPYEVVISRFDPLEEYEPERKPSDLGGVDA